MPLPYDENDDYIDDLDTIVDTDEWDERSDMDDFDSYDEWVARHVSEHGPTAEGFDALARMEKEGFFT